MTDYERVSYWVTIGILTLLNLICLAIISNIIR